MIGPILLTLLASTSIHSPVATNVTTIVPITLDFAFDHDKSTWGLMQRRSLPLDYGMLFSNPNRGKISLWAFNCYIDLAVAFLDNKGTIQEIAYLKAYPEMMDPQRPVNSLKDLHLYPDNDPILKFYWEHGVTSKRPCSYALETGITFFKDNNIVVGDMLQWKPGTPQATFHK